MPTSSPSAIPSFFAALGRPAIRALGEMGAVVLFFLHGVTSGWTARGQLGKIIRQVFFIGVKSVFVISLIGLFTGMVLGIQGYYTLVKFGSEGLLGAAVALSLIRELGPVLTAIMLTGRAGSSMTAEIGVMRISDQIDALEVMDIPAMGYLVNPRIIACLISFPLLTAMFDVIGIIGGYLTGVVLLDINRGAYFQRINSAVEMYDVMGGFYKSIAFAVIVSTICCFMGYFTHLRRDGSGPEGVSNATTSGVVVSCVFILVSDYVLTSFLL
ncbi:MlaE family ABC transporter permease [Oceanidesulfovibrio marinus]|uniref:ABC transporter permease n=1 Tax=Oceanidesulfovibrio marinus TaxID=370038 RepID=A0A6P1ZJ15_9BACT|nr:ABC transporter permease [Oceanidesulfovibrio marinus]QJT07524.1 ABC transporter permease [Oceanidesulfovibrio marinus]TVM34562.1 ABC transporter permease [Oceanidesulfovibrio marinus]